MYFNIWSSSLRRQLTSWSVTRRITLFNEKLSIFCEVRHFSKLIMAQDKVPKFKMSNGLEIPALGLGTWNSMPNEVLEAVKDAIDAGYRHIDCAFLYGNESEVGAGIRAKIDEGVVKREDLFVVSKLWNTHHHPSIVEEWFTKSLTNFGLDYLDLFLIHWPVGYKDGADPFPTDADGKWIKSEVDYVDTWKALEKLVEKGVIKSIGVSNFNKGQLQRILDNCTIPPVVNQVECHPYLNQEKLADYCKQNNILLTAYSQFGSPASPFRKPDDPVGLQDPVIEEIGKKYGKSNGHVILRWLIQRGIVTIPKSVTKARIIDNINVFDFELSDDDMKTISGLNRNHRIALFDLAMDHQHYPFHDEY